VCVPALGSIPELQAHVGDEWVRTYSGDFGASVLEHAIAWAGISRPTSPALEQFHWDDLSRSLLAAYQHVLRGKHQKHVTCANPAHSPFSERDEKLSR